MSEYKKFARIYIDGSACDECPYSHEPSQECDVELCAKRMAEILQPEIRKELNYGQQYKAYVTKNGVVTE